MGHWFLCKEHEAELIEKIEVLDDEDYLSSSCNLIGR